MLATDVAAFVRGSLPAPPARVLEVGAGEGELAALLREGGYDVLAIDPAGGDGVAPVALHEVDGAAGSFAAAVAVVSLHHVEPLAESLRRLAELLRPGAPLVVDEFDVERFDERAAEWWLAQRASAGQPHDHGAAEIVAHHRGHLHAVAQIVSDLSSDFEVGPVVRGQYLYRWDLDPTLRAVEERLIGIGAIPATGARFVARRRGA